MIKAVLFDLDDTLFDHRGCAREALAAVHQCHEGFRALSFSTLERAHARFLEQLHGDVMMGRVPLETSRLERFRRLLAVAGVTSSAEVVAGIAGTYRETYRRSRRAVAGAAALLVAVRQRARVGVVSNNLLEEQRDKLRTCALAEFVDALVVPEDAGVSKPDPAIFQMALDRLQSPAAESVMVGDSWTADVAGARAAGIRVIWFNPAGALAPAGERPARELRAWKPVEAAMETIFDTTRD